jgi:aspartokinase/homoserine dehydrogenase 1
MMVELEDVPVHSLVPEPLRDIASAADFMAALPQHDADMAARLDAAAAAGQCLRFVGAL